MPELAETILESYFRDRSASLPDVPRPRDIAGHVLAAGGSAPGHNGIPYEAYRQGVELVTEALALAVLAAHHIPAVLDIMLGPNVDLLLWIPKKAGADRPDGQRPLQLPTCFRRLFGSVITSMVAAQIEPRFSEGQASVKGGSCAKNITGAFEHLGGSTSRSTVRQGLYGGASLATPPRAPRPRARTPGGPTSGHAPRRSLPTRADGHGLAAEGHGRVEVSPLGTRGLRCPAEGKRSACMHRKCPRVRQDACKGTGNGNTPSPFLWCLGYDPIIFAVHEATGVRPPTYVDDLSALVWGPEQALAVEIFVMAAGHAAGLQIDARTCSPFHAHNGIGTARRILRALPVRVHAVGYHGGFRMTGVPGVLHNAAITGARVH